MSTLRVCKTEAHNINFVFIEWGGSVAAHTCVREYGPRSHEMRSIANIKYFIENAEISKNVIRLGCNVESRT